MLKTVCVFVIIYRNIGIFLFTFDSLDAGIAYLNTASARDKKRYCTTRLIFFSQPPVFSIGTPSEILKNNLV
jgi:hypothetical protein